MKPLSDKHVKQHNDRQEVVRKTIESHKTEIAAQHTVRKEAIEAERTAREVVEKAQQEQHNAALTINKAQESIRVLEVELIDTQKLLEADAHLKKVNALLAEQASFLDALEARLDKMQKDLTEELPDFANFLEPAKTIEKIRNISAHSGFSQVALDIRNSENFYNRLLNELCEKKINGEQIPVSMARQRNDILDRLLQTPAVESIWNLK